MEMRTGKKYGGAFFRSMMLMAFINIAAVAISQPVLQYSIKNGKMHIGVGKNVSPGALDSFLSRFNLHDLGLFSFVMKGVEDSLKKQGWQVRSDNGVFSFTKPFTGLDAFKDPADKFKFLEDPFHAMEFAGQNNRTSFGLNRFKNKPSFQVQDSVVRFYLRANKKATQVLLAGSFTNWQNAPIEMKQVDSGWVADVKLSPGKYWYKFIVNGNWQVDTDNQLRENDGQANINSVYYVPNHTFSTSDFANARKVYVAGSFNHWNRRDLQMERTAEGWKLDVYLPEGTHTYKFVADGNWYTDGANPKRFPDEFGGYNSVVELGKKHLFVLNGYEKANKVYVSGSFNAWQHHELQMQKTATGWELPYALPDGNYEYKFIVDNEWMKDPANPIAVSNATGTGNSFLIVGANYTFRLSKHGLAKEVFIAGDFNSWSPNSLRMQRDGDDWVFKLHLGPGKHRYKFVVDGNWLLDPANDLWEQNEHGTGNSVLWIEQAL